MCIILDGISGMSKFGMDGLKLASYPGNMNGEVIGAYEPFWKANELTYIVVN